VLGAPDPDALVPLYVDLLGGACVARDGDSMELGWPGGGRIRIERRVDRAPGVDRLEVDGLAAPVHVLGTWFSPAS
jgi:hypothetical protein